MEKDRFNRFRSGKKAFLTMLSGVGLVLVIWLLFFGKIKMTERLSPLLGKIPRDEVGLINFTEKVLGTAVGYLQGGGAQEVIKKGSEVFEKSPYAEPAREIRQDVVSKVNEVVDSAKDLPAQEIEIIKRQVCQEWFLEEVATESGRD